MTDATETKEQVKVPKFIIKVFSGALIIVGLIATGSLLNWAVHDKLAKVEPTNSSQITAVLREHQLDCLAKNIYYEAGNESFEGKVAVAQVSMNRTASGKFPSGVCEVIYQKNIFYEKVVCQFSWFCDRAVQFRPISKKNYDESMEVAKKVLLEGFRLPGLKEALFYHASYINPNWGKEKIAQIGQHIFYK